MPPFRLRPHFSAGGKSGLTLIELLAVIAVIAVLSTLLFTVVNYARASANRASCASNLRQIGAALQQYAYEHEMRLPGPLRVETFGYYRKGHIPDHLPGYLWGYLGLPEPDNAVRRIEVFYCPSLVDMLPANKSLNSLKAYSTGQSPQVFGYPNSTNPNQPRTIGEFDAPDKVIVLRDSAASTNAMPSPPHGNSRNILYLDWHVANVPDPVAASK